MGSDIIVQIQEGEDKPVLLHAFSNGDGYCGSVELGFPTRDVAKGAVPGGFCRSWFKCGLGLLWKMRIGGGGVWFGLSSRIRGREGLSRFVVYMAG